MYADKEMIARFLTIATKDSIQLSAIHSDGGPPECRWFGNDVAAATKWAAERNGRGCNIYWSVNYVQPGLNRKAAKADIIGFRYVHVDIDPPKNGGHFDKASISLDLEFLSLPPTIIIDSGGGLQAFWRLRNDPGIDATEQLNRAIEDRFGGDRCHNVDRIMRVPGTVNYPNSRKRKSGRVPVLAKLSGGFSDSTYSADQLFAAFTAFADGSEIQCTEGEQGGNSSIDVDANVSGKLSSLGIAQGTELHRLLAHPAGADRSRDVYAAACEMARLGFDDSTIACVLLDPDLPISGHCLDQSDPDRAAMRAIEKARTSLGSEGMVSSVINATPFSWPAPADIPRRQWLYGKQLLRGTLAQIIAPGATGKSAYSVGVALSLASGQPLLGKPIPGGPQRVWLWNLEDSKDELNRAFIAASTYHGISPFDTGDRLFVDSGLDGDGLCTGVQLREGPRILQPVYDRIVAELQRRQIDVLIIDPFVSSHSVPENDNTAIDAIAKAWAKVARRTDCTVVLVHHTAKLGGAEVTVDKSRGASALTNAARSVVALNRMSEREAAGYGISPLNARRYIRAYDDKNNRAPPADASDWYYLESITLPNGVGDEILGDSVAVVIPWVPPNRADDSDLDDEAIRAIRVAVGDGGRKNAQSPKWVGVAIGAALGIDSNCPFGRKTIEGKIKASIAKGILNVIQAPDPQSRKPVQWIVQAARSEADLPAAPLRDLAVEQGGAEWSGATNRLCSTAPPAPPPLGGGVVERSGAEECGG